MKIKVRTKNASQPMEFDALGAYEKGSFYCVQVIETEEVSVAAIGGIRFRESVVKIPIADIFQVVEDYGYRAPKGASELERGPK